MRYHLPHTRHVLRPLLVLLAALLLTTPPIPIQTQAHAQEGERCFPETGSCIAGRIRAYWEQNGGLPVFGLPITPQQEEIIEGRPLQVQWFERNRLELHPENAPPYDVLLGRLGVDVLAQQGRDWQSFPRDGAPQDGCRYFAETGQNVCGDILAQWRANGLELGDPGISEAETLALFGLPISPAQTEVIDGKEYTVQWFERARFERHPQNQPPDHVLLGLLGREMRSAATGAAPPAPAPEPAPAGTTPRVEIGELTTYTHPDGSFSIDVPAAWDVEDVSNDAAVSVGFVDPTRHGLIAASGFENPSPMQLVDPALMGEVLQQGIQTGFGDRENLVIGTPEPQPDGSVRVPFTLDDTIDGNTVSLQGNGYIREDGSYISLLWAVVPLEQFDRLEPSLNTIISSYRVHRG